MPVTQYEMRFRELSCSAFLVPTENERIHRFVEGLNYSLRFGMAREVETETNFHRPIDIAKRLECIRRQKIEDRKAKKPHGTGGFSNAYSRGKGLMVKAIPVDQFSKHSG